MAVLYVTEQSKPPKFRSEEYSTYWSITGSAYTPPETVNTGVGRGSFLDAYFSLRVDANGVNYLECNLDIASLRDIRAFSGDGAQMSYIWDSMPIASETVLGAIKVGANLTIDSDGTLNAQAGEGSSATSWGEISGTISTQTDLWNQLQSKYSSGNTNIGTGATNYAAGNHTHSSYEPIITAGTTLQYYRGDKTWASLNTSVVAEGTNLYFTAGRAQGAITGGASTIVTSNLTASRVLYSNTSGKVAVSPITAVELSYLGGVTSAIQTQFNARPQKSVAESISALWNFGGGVRIDYNTTQGFTIQYSTSTNDLIFYNPSNEVVGRFQNAGNFLVSNDVNAQTFKITNSSGTVQYVIKYNAISTKLEFLNSSAVVIATLDTNGNFIAKGELTAFGSSL